MSVRSNVPTSVRAILSFGAVLLFMLIAKPWESPQAAAQSEITLLNNLQATAQSAVPTQESELAAQHSIYLPLVSSAGKVNPTVTPKPSTTTTPSVTPKPSTTPTTPTPGTTTGSLFFNKGVKNNSGDIKIDAAGGMHSAYAHFLPNANKPPVVYSYCAGPKQNCASINAWKSVTLTDQAKEVQLNLTPAGKPRMLIVNWSTVYPNGLDYFYAACDNDCTNKNSWSLTFLMRTDATAIHDTSDDSQPQRTFALDNQGRPRFVYQDRNYANAEPDHIGAFYAWCDTNCSDVNNWFETKIGREKPGDNEIFNYTSLTFTKGGAPRLVARVFAMNEDGSAAPTGLYYLGCDTGCDERSGWWRVFLLNTGSGSFPHPSWDLELTSNDSPRIAIFLGGASEFPDYDRTLNYMWCNQNCKDSNSWFISWVGLDRDDGQGADLVLDAQNRPRLAWPASNGDIGYSWCNTACETENAEWKHKIVKTEAQLKAENPQAIPTHCDTDTWNAMAPAITLDSTGNPYIVSDVAVRARCFYDETPGDPSDPLSSRFEDIWRGVHLDFFAQP